MNPGSGVRCIVMSREHQFRGTLDCFVRLKASLISSQAIWYPMVSPVECSGSVELVHNNNDSREQ